MKKALVAGAGLSGATAARVLAESGCFVTVLERQNRVGGLCHDEKFHRGIFVHRFGPHVFHTADETVRHFLGRFTDWIPFEHRVLARVGGKTVPFPICTETVNGLFGLSLDGPGLRTFLQQEVERSRFCRPPRNFRDAVVSKVGERLYETLYRGYTQKQWGRDPEDLSPHLAGRIPVRHDGETRYFDDPFQAVPAGGYTRLVEAMLDHENILLERGVDFFDARSSRQADLVVYTGELDRFFDYRWGKLEYRSMEPEFLTLDVECHQPAAVVNYPDDGVPWTRITEFKHFTGAKTPKTVICREYPKALGTPCYVVMTEENLRKRDLYMKEARRLEAAGRCLFTGRLAEYRYCNMDQAVAGALAKLRQHLQAR